MSDNKPRSNLLVSAVQMVSGNDLEGNFQRARQFIEEIVATSETKLIIFPENFLCFGGSYVQKNRCRFSSYVKKFQVIAKQNSVSLVLGSIPISASSAGNESENDKFFSRSFVINDNGDVVDTYDKLHLFDVDVADQHGQYRESDSYVAGERVIVSDIASIQLGMSICYDVRFPELFQELVVKGADVIAVPAAFTEVTGRAHWEVLLRARAIETQCFIIAANQGGTHPDGRETWGHSMIIDPWGEVLASVDKGEGFCSSVLDFDKLTQTRRSMNIQSHKRQI